MAKKSFKDIPALAFISQDADRETMATQEEQYTHGTHDTYATHNTQDTHLTQSKKGQKLPRVNMAFATTNLEYLRIISRIEGVSITAYVNRLVETDMAAKQNIITEAKKIF